MAWKQVYRLALVHEDFEIFVQNCQKSYICDEKLTIDKIPGWFTPSFGGIYWETPINELKVQKVSYLRTVRKNKKALPAALVSTNGRDQ